jgi:hypothetical protein
MTAAEGGATRTVIGALVEALGDAASYNRSEMGPPAAVLWPDKEQQWVKLIPVLRHQLSQLLTLGEYDGHARTGPAVWIKCMVARQLADVPFAPDATPIIYLPGISRAELRDVEDCPLGLQPLAELQYRGVWFTQPNAKDWTVLAFLCSKEAGIGLDLARDAATLDALQHTLVQLGRTRLDQLKGTQLTHETLNALVHADPVRAILDWLDDANNVHERDADQWKSFRGICKNFGFDPETDGRIVAAERLGRRDGKWAHVWNRFTEAPQSYARIPDLLRKAQPNFKNDLFDDPSPWPRENETREAKVRDALTSLASASQSKAIEVVTALEREHGVRRGWVWAQLALAPLAAALEHLAKLAALGPGTLPGATRDEMAASYRESGWQVDAAAVDALSTVNTTADEDAVRTAVRALYLPWLERNAERLQQLLAGDPVPTHDRVPVQPLDAGTCIVFVDGMRYDVGRRLATAMRSHGWEVVETARWTAMPSVTATAKPAASPVADLVVGGATDAEFCARVAATGAALTADRFRQLVEQQGIEYLPRSERGTPTGRAWTEIGDLDRRGHEEGVRLARRVAESVADIVARVEELLDAGWKRVKLVTDHGWLLMPGGLPKVNLSAYLAASRWGRCAALKQTSIVEVPVVPWYWNSQVRVALAPGVGVFIEGREYTHGGATLQECMVPVLVVTRGASAGVDARIASVEWVHLRCKIQIEGEFAGCRVDIRTKPGDSKTSVAAPKGVPENGRVSVVVEDDDLEQSAAVVVLLDASGQVVAKQATTVGG